MENNFTKKESAEVFEYLSTGENRLSKEAEYKLYCILMNEMPYGVAKPELEHLMNGTLIISEVILIMNYWIGLINIR